MVKYMERNPNLFSLHWYEFNQGLGMSTDLYLFWYHQVMVACVVVTGRTRDRIHEGWMIIFLDEGHGPGSSKICKYKVLQRGYLFEP